MLVRAAIACAAIGGALALTAMPSQRQAEKPVESAAPAPARSHPTAIDHSPKIQAERKKLIQSMIGRGIFSRVEQPGSLPRVWVTPTFYTLDFTQKQQFISVVYAYYFEGNDISAAVRLFDGLNNKEIGSFSLPGGLKLR